MSEILVPIIAILSTVALPICLGMYLGIISCKAKHKENMELIKQGIIPEHQQKSTPNRHRALRNGMLCIGIGLGIIVGLITSHLLNIGGESPTIIVIVGSPILIFLGIAYVVFYLITKDKNFDDNCKNEEMN